MKLRVEGEPRGMCESQEGCVRVAERAKSERVRHEIRKGTSEKGQH